MNLRDIENKYKQEASDMEDAYTELVGKLEIRIKKLEANNERLKEQLVQEAFANELLLKEIKALRNLRKKTDINISP